ncbi:MAG: SIS domain-containing protein [Caldisphaera sp.]
MWYESLKIQSKCLSDIINNDDLSRQVNSVIPFLKNAKGVIYFTGIGKNMYTAARVSDTFQSLGIRGLFIDAINTLHGGMGIFLEEDVLIAISKSGETEELLRLIQILNERKFKNIIAVTSNGDSTLRKLSRLSIVIPVENEGDHLGLAPISSTMVYGAVLDSIAVQISSERKFTRNNFIFNHPGGSLGKLKG